ncbi:MAG: hypothetical protein ACOC2L_00635, partial [Candidatus Sumerlaeota bacterium]
MTKKEVHVLAALIVVIAAGLAVRAWKEKHDAGAYILVEQGRPSSYRQHQPDSQSPPFAYSSEVPSKASSSQQQMYGADGRL